MVENLGNLPENISVSLMDSLGFSTQKINKSIQESTENLQQQVNYLRQNIIELEELQISESIWQIEKLGGEEGYRVYFDPTIVEISWIFDDKSIQRFNEHRELDLLKVNKVIEGKKEVFFCYLKSLQHTIPLHSPIEATEEDANYSSTDLSTTIATNTTIIIDRGKVNDPKIVKNQKLKDKNCLFNSVSQQTDRRRDSSSKTTDTKDSLFDSEDPRKNKPSTQIDNKKQKKSKRKRKKEKNKEEKQNHPLLLCHHCKVVKPQNCFKLCQRKILKTDMDPLTNLTRGFQGFKSHSNSICHKAYCFQCLKGWYNMSIPSIKYFECPFCINQCFCSRCSRRNSIQSLSTLYQRYGGNQETLINLSPASCLAAKIINKDVKVEKQLKSKIFSPRKKRKRNLTVYNRVKNSKSNIKRDYKRVLGKIEKTQKALQLIKLIKVEYFFYFQRLIFRKEKK